MDDNFPPRRQTYFLVQDDAPAHGVTADCHRGIIHVAAPVEPKHLHAAIHGRQGTIKYGSTRVANVGRNHTKCSNTSKAQVRRARNEHWGAQGSVVGRPSHEGKHQSIDDVLVSNIVSGRATVFFPIKLFSPRTQYDKVWIFCPDTY